MDRWKHFRAQAIIFDKDGTLIDFDAMWGGWVVYLAEQLRSVSGLDVHRALCLAMGYDETTRKVLANGKLASRPMSQLYQATIEVVQSFGLSKHEAKCVVEKAWCIPDPVILAKQLTDTRALFSSLYDRGIQIAIATADDRAPTQAMIEAFDIEEFIGTMVCADDGIPSKPAPDMVLTVCERLKLDPRSVMVIGDTASDLKMARAAGAGLAVGVLSGVSSAKDLIPYAHVLIESVDELHAYILELDEAKSARSQQGLDPDFAF
jgi:phosphoglycolate phosphatase-like HAD superfamily hydrolase